MTNLTTTQKKGFDFLNTNTLNQRNNYCNSFINYETQEIANILKYAKEGKMGECADYYIYQYTKKQENIPTLKIEWIEKANKYFDSKLITMVGKLNNFGMLENNIKLSIDSLQVDENLGLEFYLRGFDTDLNQDAGRVHARLVWVSCWDKCSHYRFICTLKK